MSTGESGHSVIRYVAEALEQLRQVDLAQAREMGEFSARLMALEHAIGRIEAGIERRETQSRASSVAPREGSGDLGGIVHGIRKNAKTVGVITGIVFYVTERVWALIQHLPQ